MLSFTARASTRHLAREQGELMSALHPDTLAVTAGRPHAAGEATATPLTLASAFRGDDEQNPYARTHGTPTWHAFEAAVGALEGGESVAFASGMAATAAILDALPVGARVVAGRVSYLGLRHLLNAPAGRWTPVLVDTTDDAAVIEALRDAQLLWLESVSNPLLSIADTPRLLAAARDVGVPTVVDATFATPVLARPLSQGATLSLHSASKYLGGHGDLLLGVVSGAPGSPLLESVRAGRALRGGTPGGLEAWLATRGLRTLPLRLRRAQESAGILAEHLEAHPRVSQVVYPGLWSHPQHARVGHAIDGPGAMLAFTLAGGRAAAEALCERVRLITHATSLGGVESSLERRRRWPGESAEVPESLIRMSVGCEDPVDLWEDLRAALA
jgi:cystathionine gamma-synthase